MAVFATLLIIWYAVSSSIRCHVEEEYETTLLVRNPLDQKNIEFSLGAYDLDFLLMSSTAIVDKSLLIKKLFDTDFRVALFTYPDGWGKTINLNMIKTFLKLEVDELGVVVPYKKRENVRLFKQGEKYTKDQLDSRLNKPFMIARYEQFCDKYMSNYPVISVSFFGISERTYKDMLDEIRDKIGAAFRDHEYMMHVYNTMLKSDKVVEAKKDEIKTKMNKFEKYMDGHVNMAELQDSLKFLSDVLYEHHNKHSYVFIDDYDDPFRHMLRTYLITESEQENFIDFFAAFVARTFHTTSHVKRGFITGTLKLAAEQYFAPIKNFVDYHFLDNKWREFFGFQHREVEAIFNLASVPSKIRKRAYDYYDGFGAGLNRTERLYNCISITSFLLHKFKTLRYTVNFDQVPPFLQRFFGMKDFLEAIEKLLKGEELELSESTLGNLTITRKGYKDLKNYVSLNHRLDDADLLSSMYKILFTHGYLSLADDSAVGAPDMVRTDRLSCSSESIERKLLVRLPNKEILNELKEYYENLVLGVNDDKFDSDINPDIR